MEIEVIGFVNRMFTLTDSSVVHIIRRSDIFDTVIKSVEIYWRFLDDMSQKGLAVWGTV